MKIPKGKSNIKPPPREITPLNLQINETILNGLANGLAHLEASGDTDITKKDAKEYKAANEWIRKAYQHLRDINGLTSTS